MSEAQTTGTDEQTETNSELSCPVCGDELEEIGEKRDVNALLCRTGSAVIEVGNHE